MATELRHFINKMLQKYARIIPATSVLNIGALQNRHDKEGRLYRDYFRNAEWYTVEKRSIPGPHHYAIDLMDVSIIDRQFDLILNIAVLEHVSNPFVVTNNLKALLEDGGYMFVAVPYVFERHGVGFGDYWRFTDDGLRMLHGDMAEIGMHAASRENEPSGYVGVFKKR